MAKQVITMLTDDLTGDAADETIIFGIDGMAYTIDLAEDNAKELRTFLERYTAAGSRLGRIPTGGAPSAAPVRRFGGTSPAKVDREQNAAIREWAARNGLQVAERGRISQHIVDAFHRGVAPKSALKQDALPAMPPPAPEPEPEAKPVARKVVAAKATKAAPAKKTTARSAK